MDSSLPSLLEKDLVDGTTLKPVPGNKPVLLILNTNILEVKLSTKL